MYQYQNPIIRGYNPDPSFCRVGDDFYLVTSSFEFFPGVPLYHSKNLADWEMLGSVLTRDSQLNLHECRSSGGIYAPTIRYHDGVFYMITTNVTDKGNFIVHTKDIRGEWSEPMWVDQGGIDPSLLFDDDGKVYFCSTSADSPTQGIALCQVNPLTGERLSDTVVIHYGSGGKCPEAPHIYKRNGMYYLMIAEGGTEYGHMETMFRAENPYGPYEPCPHNPILSHKDYMGSPIQATGHADIMEDQNGNWWLCCLAIRPLGHTMLHNLGRETFLAPVVWNEDGWPVVGNMGRIEMKMEANLPGAPAEAAGYCFEDNFDEDKLLPQWTFVRNPKPENYSLTENKKLRLTAGEETLNSFCPTFVGVRQPEFCIQAQTKMTSDLLVDSAAAGLTAFYNKDYHYAVCIARKGDGYAVELRKTIHDIRVISDCVEIVYAGEIEFKVETDRRDYTFYYRTNGEWQRVGKGTAAGLCTEGTMDMTFTGTFIGLFASNTSADFDSFSMREVPEKTGI